MSVASELLVYVDDEKNCVTKFTHYSVKEIRDISTSNEHTHIHIINEIFSI